MAKQMCCVQPFKDYRVLIGKQVLKQRFAASRLNNKGFLAEEVKKIQVTPVIMYPEALALKCSGTCSPVTEAVKDDIYTLFFQ